MKKTKFYIVVIFLGAFFMTACEYDFVVRDPIGGGSGDDADVIVPDPDNPISFSDKIAPIFTNGNYCTACHNTGGQTPNLEAASSYNSLTSGGYVNTSAPEESIILTNTGPGTSGHAWKKLTATQAAKILLWITEGAMNN